MASGSRLGFYEVLAPLGVGGMGEVYRARDTRLGREVAIKVLPEVFARDPVRVARFEREAKLLAALNHPNIAAIYELGQTGETRFLVLELVPGDTLKELLAKGRLPLERALPIARQIAEALASAHGNAILHRDLKPANVKVTREGTVKLLDFGLAKALSVTTPAPDFSQSPADADATHQGMIVGTASYMSPEQARGKHLDPRSDIWAFGCVLYEMLAGSKAFGGQTLMDILVAILDKEPDWDALPPEIPPRVRALLGDCLQKDAGQRLSQIEQARTQIDAALEAGLGARSATVAVAAPRPAEERHTARWATGATLLALTAAAVWVGVRSTPGKSTLPNEKYLAVLAFRDLSGQPGAQLYGAGLAESVAARLSKVPGLQIMPPSAPLAAGAEADLTQIVQDRGANLVLRGSYRRDGDRMRVAYALLAPGTLAQLAGDEVEGSASNLFGLEDRLLESVTTSLKVRLNVQVPPSRAGLEKPETQGPYFQALGALQRYDDASFVDTAISLLSALPGGGESGLVEAALARAYLARYGLTRDTRWAGEAQKACETAVRLDPNEPAVHVTLSQILRLTGKAPEAVAEAQKAVSAQPDNADAVLALAEAEEDAGQSREAEASYRRAIQLRPSLWSGYNKLAGFYFDRGEHEKARATYAAAINLNPRVARVHANLGAVLGKLGRFDEAEAEAKTSIALTPSAPAYSNLGTLQYLRGRFADAATSFEKATALRPKDPGLFVNLGDALTQISDRRLKALAAYQEAIRLGKETLAVNPNDGDALALVALSEARTGHIGEGWQKARQAVLLAPANSIVLYRAALVANLAKKKPDALRLLKEALKSGYAAVQLEHEPAFADLAGDAEFQRMVKGRGGQP